MTKKLTALLLCLILAVGLLPAGARAAGGVTGSGTINDPYVVDNYGDLKAKLQSDEGCYIRVDSFRPYSGLDYYIIDSLCF